MAELTSSERLQPSLLDRLTDFEPTKNVESRDRSILSLHEIRQAVLRDLGWLFNTSNLAAVVDLDELADAEEQGLISRDQLEKALRRANRLLNLIYEDKFPFEEMIKIG